jgi:UDP:flavonoid glycosyltransferase YjiC (YdhE family)
MHIEQFIDGDAVMKICDVVICHGGNGTIYQALSHGKPVLGLPTIPDQSFNMRRVTALGVGWSLAPKDVLARPELIRQAVHSALTDAACRERAEVFGKSLREWDAPVLAAQAIEKQLQQRST